MKPKSWLKQLSLPAVLLLGTLPLQTVNAAEPSHLEMPHSAGTFMVEVSAMRMNMSGLRADSDDVSTAEAISDFGYVMLPTDMTMDMLMVMPMYNITKDLSTMLMMGYISNSMDMTNGAGTCTSTMETSGISDTQASLSYKFMDDMFAASMELSIPTGSIDESTTMKMGAMCMPMTMEHGPYQMQLGSGTYDVTPSLTYLGAYFSLRYGAQVSYKYRIDENDNGYTLGDEATAKLWIRKPISMVTLSGELDFKRWGDIEGVDPDVPAMMPTPTVRTSNSGGSIAEITIGAEVPVSMVSLGLDLTMPVYQDYNGLQMKRSMSAALSVSAMF